MSVQEINYRSIRVEDTDSYTALFNGGWNIRRGCQDRNVIVKRYDVPEFGTYKVNVTISACDKNLTDLTLFAGRRNMIARNISISKGEVYRKSFYQAVFPYIPALMATRCNEKCIFVSVAGADEGDLDGVMEVQITREEVPVIWVAGDSTVTDQNAGIPYYPYGSCAGWAQMLTRYAIKAAVCNLSHSGMTSNCFRDDGHYAICQEFIKEGDFFIIQFGHNDQKRRNLSPYGGYADNLRRYVAEIREAGAEPIICSPISRIPLELSEDEAKELSMPRYYSLLKAHADACRDVAKELQVCFVDLHRMTFDKWVELGSKARDYFMPGDITHTNEYGAVLISDLFVKTMMDLGDGVIGSFYDEFLPDSASKELPQDQPGPGIFDIEPPYLDIKGIPEYEGIRKAFKYALLDPCVMYLHPYDVMPRGQLLMVMFNAFRMPGIRPYRKRFADIQVDEWISGYVQALIENDLLDDSSFADEFRPDDPLAYEELAQFLVIKLEGRRAGDYLPRAIELGLFDETRSKEGGKPVNRAEVYIALARYMDYVGTGNESLPSDAEVHPVH